MEGRMIRTIEGDDLKRSADCADRQKDGKSYPQISQMTQMEEEMVWARRTANKR